MYFSLVLKTQFLKSGSLDGKFGMENRLLETAFKKILLHNRWKMLVSRWCEEPSGILSDHLAGLCILDTLLF